MPKCPGKKIPDLALQVEKAMMASVWKAPSSTDAGQPTKDWEKFWCPRMTVVRVPNH